MLRWIIGASNPEFRRCAFRSNHASDKGGAVVVHEQSSAVFTECVFYV
jgi:hypothetical protein